MRMSQTTSALLILSLVFSPFASAADSADRDLSTTGLEKVAGVLNLANQGVGALQYSQQQMQSMVNQFALLQQQNSGLTASMSQFDQIKQQLSVTLATASQCIEASKKDLTKYKKLKLTPARLNTVEPTCETYGAILDSVAGNSDQLTELQQKMVCLKNLQDKVGAIAENSKGLFKNLNEAATGVYNSHQKIVDAHQGIVDKVNKDLNDPDNGYKAQLGKLKEMSVNIQNAINAGQGKESTGIGAELRALKKERVVKANYWYQGIMNDVDGCFAQDGTKTCSFGVTGSPMECIRGYLGQSNTPAEKASALVNLRNLGHAFNLNSGIFRRTDTLAKIDVNDPASFRQHVEKRFNEKLNAATTTFTKLSLQGKANKTAVREFVRQKYTECYQDAMKRFDDDTGAAGGMYKNLSDEVKEKELNLNNNIRNLIDQAQATMTSFRTSFNRIYNRDLSQFAATCSAGDNPYASADCLRKLSLTLKGGIEGTKQSATMENGSVESFTPGATTLNLQSLTLDQTGNASITTTQTQCVGFDECINVMDRYQESHATQADNQRKQQAAAVEAHNKSVTASMTAMGAQFTAISAMILEGANNLNQDASKFGVSGSLEIKQLDGEALKPDEKTGIFGTPTSMKAAFAGTGSYSEMGSPAELGSAIAERRQELGDIKKEALKMKALCSVKRSDFDAVANRLGSCDPERICGKGKGATGVGQMLQPLERLMQKSQMVPNADDKGMISSEFRSCEADNKSSVDLSQFAGLDGEKGEKKEMVRLMNEQKEADNIEGRRTCTLNAVSDLEAMAAESRGTLSETNDSIMSGVRKIADACPEDKDEAANACEGLKKSLKSAQPPEDEGETKIGEAAAEQTKFTNPLTTLPETKSAQ